MKTNERNYVLAFLATLAVLTSGLIVFLLVGLGTRPDERYAKFIQSGVKSLALGTSYTDVGIAPSVLNESHLPFEGPLYNFAFTNGNSQWGPVYDHAIRTIIDGDVTNGLFLVQSNPRTFTVAKSKKSLGIDGLSEKGGFLDQIDDIRRDGPLDYYLTRLSDSLPVVLWYKLVVRNESLDDDGHHVVLVDKTPKEIENAMRRKLAGYEEELQTDEFSEDRWNWFVKTVRFLDEHGTVVFVRLPSTDRHADIEDRLVPGMDERVEALARSLGTVFLNYKGTREYVTNDGAHLNYKSAPLFSRDLAEDLRKVLKASDSPAAP